MGAGRVGLACEHKLTRDRGGVVAADGRGTRDRQGLRDLVQDDLSPIPDELLHGVDAGRRRESAQDLIEQLIELLRAEDPLMMSRSAW